MSCVMYKQFGRTTTSTTQYTTSKKYGKKQRVLYLEALTISNDYVGLPT